MSLHDDHRALAAVSALGFLALTAVVAIAPSLGAQRVQPHPGPAADDDARRGRAIYLREGCGYCHTQFVRDLPLDAPYGRASVAADYAGEDPPLLGTQRTGPDLSDVGRRQPSDVWHLLHLYDPRIVVPTSVMPGYPWYFERKPQADPGDVVIPVPEEHLAPPGSVVVARPEAVWLTRYLLSLRQVEVPR